MLTDKCLFELEVELEWLKFNLKFKLTRQSLVLLLVVLVELNLI